MALHIFTDGSVNTQLKVGYGAYLAVTDLSTSIDSLKDKVRVRRFEQTSSTRLELQTLLWALSDLSVLINNHDMVLTVYTDSQNIIDLPKRQAQLEQNNYLSSKNRQLNHCEMYREFYQITSKPNYQFVKVKGHQPFQHKNEIDMLFSLVDKSSRRAMRKALDTVN